MRGMTDVEHIWVVLLTLLDIRLIFPKDVDEGWEDDGGGDTETTLAADSVARCGTDPNAIVFSIAL
jgi:hypothetical protein